MKVSVSLLSSLVTTVEYARVDKGEYVTPKSEITTVEERTEIIIEQREQREMKEEDTWRAPEIPPPQTITERDDDWFLLWDVVPRETSYVPPGTAKHLPVPYVLLGVVLVT